MGNELLLMLDGEDSQPLSTAAGSAAVTSVMMASLLLVLSPLLLLLPVDEHDSDDNLRLIRSVLLQLQSSQ